MHLFGLTGGIASGKSTVAARLRQRKVPVIDADVLAREAVLPGSPALHDIVEAFGSAVLDSSGALDRKGLAAVVFRDELSRRKLNGIIHPRITALSLQRAQALAARGEPLACYEAALIVENGVQDMFRPLVVVSAPDELQLERLQSRDHASREDALARIRAQKPLAEKVAVADYVIETVGTLAENARRTDEVLRAICEKLGVDFARYALVEEA